MDNSSLILKLDTILSNNDYCIQFIYFCCGLYNDNSYYDELSSKGKWFIIGKIMTHLKTDLYNYINYIIILIDNKDSSLKLKSEISIINNLHMILNSLHKSNFLSFLYGFSPNYDWGEFAEHYENSYIVGKLIDINEDAIFVFCKYIIEHNNTPPSNNMVSNDD